MDESGHYIMLKASFLQDEITVLDVYVPKNRASNFMQQKLMKLQREMDPSTIRVGDFSNPLTKMDRSNRKKIYEHIVELSNTSTQQDVIDIY